MARFKIVSSQIDFIALEKELLDYWYKNGIVEKYLKKNSKAERKFSFLDGPITANNPMGVHHAWGRAYKDLWQRFYNMKGYKERFQNGFDEQGLWVEVEVEKELGLKSKKDIENLIPGDKFASLEKFVNLCKERVKKYSAIQTEQSKRLGYFMDWDNSYHTSSDENNYAIWNFLKVVNEKGWLYKGRDSVPWCPRCGTAISQHEILTEEYKELTHTSVYFKLPVKNKPGVNLLVWTTTPWTIPANVAVAVDPKLNYLEAEIEGESYIIAKDLVERVMGEIRVIREYKGKDLVGWEYNGPFDSLPAVKDALGDYQHRVIASDPLILPISTEEGTGLVHIAPGAGAEDFALGKKENLPVAALLDETATFVGGLGELEGLGVKEAGTKIIGELEKNDFLFKTLEYVHRYPTCWRCKTELVWRVVNEWYIATDKPSNSKFKIQNSKFENMTYREQMVEVAKHINWFPAWGLDRELDWLKNMHDWLISKKRYWGLALPIWECGKCGGFEVVGSKEELKGRAVEGWEEYIGHSPHKPWVDQVKIKCSRCGEIASRIPDVGNPWLDAGIVPFSTMPEEWFPADFVTEAFPGQFKNWFYSLIAMSTALKGVSPYRNLLGHALVMDEKGEPMHKSSGNMIEFNEAADKIGVDVMRWIYLSQNPEYNLNFGFGVADQVRRRFYLILWNSYKFFLDYANLAEWGGEEIEGMEGLGVLDRWVLSRLNEVILTVNNSLENYDATTSSRAIEDFVVGDLSTWYIRRSRDRVGPGAEKLDEQAFLNTSYKVFTTLSKLLAPFTPFIAEEIFKNLTGKESVHLEDYPEADESLIDEGLMSQMSLMRKMVEIGHAQRKEANIKLRQPLQKFTYMAPDKLNEELEKIMADELNIKVVKYNSSEEKLTGQMDTNITPQLKAEGETRELIREIQNLRKEKGLTLKDKIKIESPSIPESEELKKVVLVQTNALEIIPGENLLIEIVR